MGFMLGSKYREDDLGCISKGEFERLRKRVGRWSVWWRGDMERLVCICDGIGYVVGRNGEHLKGFYGMAILKEVEVVLERVDRELSDAVRDESDGRIAGGRCSVGDYVVMNLEFVRREMKKREVSSEVYHGRICEWDMEGGELQGIYGVF